MTRRLSFAFALALHSLIHLSNLHILTFQLVYANIIKKTQDTLVRLVNCTAFHLLIVL